MVAAAEWVGLDSHELLQPIASEPQCDGMSRRRPLVYPISFTQAGYLPPELPIWGDFWRSSAFLVIFQSLIEFLQIYEIRGLTVWGVIRITRLTDEGGGAAGDEVLVSKEIQNDWLMLIETGLRFGLWVL